VTAAWLSGWPRLQRRHPELGPACVVVGSWAVMVALDAQRHGGGMSAPADCGACTATASLGSWLLMIVAMMGPAALGGVRHTAVSSLCWRRRRAVAEFSASYLAVWAAFGLVVVAATAALPVVPGWPALAATLAVAAVWQVTPWKGRRLRDCHRSVPLPPYGWRAERAALEFGLRQGVACVGSCWCLMLVMVAVPSANLPWTVGLTALVAAERWSERPRRTTRLAAVVLAIAAIAAGGAAIGVS